jgi:hypothetical protein
MSARKVCINHPSSYYTGKEQSPLHFGLSAEGYDINSIMEGYDKDLWIVEVRNSKKVWTKKESINKMTYEIPLITETTGDLRTGDLRTGDLRTGDLRTGDLRTGDLRTGDLKECDVSNASVAIVEPIVETVVLPSVATEPVVAPSVATEDNKKTKPKARKTATAATAANAATAKPVAVAAKPAKPATATDATAATAAANPVAKPVDATDATVSTKPVAATATATDYTLFITYRIQQLKKECADNKKNYDCARYEWKEYKNKPDELREIMVAARQKASDDTK